MLNKKKTTIVWTLCAVGFAVIALWITLAVLFSFPQKQNTEQNVESETQYVCEHLSFTTVTQNATCTDFGNEKKVCDKCGKILETTVLPPTGHDYADAENNGNCVTCGKKICSPGMRYTLTDDETSYIVSDPAYACGEDVVIPEYHENLPVTEIKDDAFSGRAYIKSVSIPKTIKTIGVGAFNGCNKLSKLYYNAESAADFRGINWVFYYADEALMPKIDVTIGKAVKRIPARLFYPHNAFSGVIPFISSLTFESGGKLEAIGDYAFYKTNLGEISFPTTVKEIGAHAFESSNIASVTFNENIQSIGDYAFNYCKSLKTIDLSNTKLQNVGDGGFKNSALEGVKLSKNLQSLGAQAFYNCDVLTIVEMPSCKRIGDEAFKNCSSIKNVTLPNDLQYLGYSAFEGCAAIESVVISSDIYDLPPANRAFYGAGILGAEVTIADGVESIPSRLFYSSADVEKNIKISLLTIPRSVQKIGSNAFFGVSTEKVKYVSTTAIAGEVSEMSIKESTMKDYEIYPKPHNISYSDEIMVVTQSVDAFIGNKIDEVTSDKLFDALSKIDVVASPVQSKSATNIYLGVYGSGDAADLFVRANVDIPRGHFDKIDSYILYLGSNSIAILGKDTDAAFYGVTTLAMIFSQTENRTLRRLTVIDYSDSAYRGFIEGYYGTPWTTAERIDLMRFGSQFKTNIYIYAPKDDPYHSRAWRGLYSGADYAALKEQIEAGAKTKTKFTWSVHPLMENSNPFRRENYQNDIADLLAKLEQVYEAGCRSFMISADDIDEKNVDAECQRDMLNDVQKWLDDKGDCHNLIFVTSSYCVGFDSPSFSQTDYYKKLINGLNTKIEIMWTGQNVCSRLSDGAFDKFKELTSNKKPFFWMNWPVTDYNPTYLLLGAPEVLDIKTDNGKAPFSGVVLNPMEYAEMSKISIFGVADYCWNIDDFDQNENYGKSFKYIEDGAPDALKEIASHLTNTPGKLGDEYFKESAVISAYIERFLSAYDKGDFKKEGELLCNQFDVIYCACVDYVKYGKNTALLKTMAPWIESLKRASLAAKSYINLLMNADGGTIEKYNEADALYKSILDCPCPVLKSWAGSPVYEPCHIGATVITPFIEKLRSLAIENVALPLGLPTGITVKGFGAFYGGTGPIEKIFDGDENTFVWFEGHPADGDYIRIDLSVPQDILSLRILNGKPRSTGGGDIIKGYVDCSLDGKTYNKIGILADDDVGFVFQKPVRARYIRIVSENTTTYAAIREVYVNDLHGLKTIVSTENFGDLYGGTKTSSVIDGDENTFAWFTSGGNGSLTIDMLDEFTLEKVRVLAGASQDEGRDDTINGHIEYSVDGKNYIAIGNLSGSDYDKTITLSESVTARYIRIVNDGTSHFVAIREIYIN